MPTKLCEGLSIGEVEQYGHLRVAYMRKNPRASFVQELSESQYAEAVIDAMINHDVHVIICPELRVAPVPRKKWHAMSNKGRSTVKSRTGYVHPADYAAAINEVLEIPDLCNAEDVAQWGRYDVDYNLWKRICDRGLEKETMYPSLEKLLPLVDAKLQEKTPEHPNGRVYLHEWLEDVRSLVLSDGNVAMHYKQDMNYVALLNLTTTQPHFDSNGDYPRQIHALGRLNTSHYDGFHRMLFSPELLEIQKQVARERGIPEPE